MFLDFSGKVFEIVDAPSRR